MYHANTEELNANKLRDEFALPEAQKHYAPDLEIEPVHEIINLTVDPWEKRAEGWCEIILRGNVAGGQTLLLDAMNFEDVSVETTQGPNVTSRYDGSQIHLYWEKPFAVEEKRAVRVHYTVVEPVTGLVISAPTDDDPDAPILAATDNETERARYWYPCVDFLTIRTTLEFILTARKALTILANGLLQSEKENNDGTKTAHWKLDYPCPSYLACFAIGNFNRHDDATVDGVPLSYFADKSYSVADIHRTFAKTPEMLRWLPEKLGVPFPFPKYYQFAGREIGGAMENISLVSWDDHMVQDETYAKEIGYRVDLINIHEMTHSYFGDAVVSRDFAHVWLKESWATYMESVWAEEFLGKDAKDWQMYAEKVEYLSEADNNYQRPIVTRTYDSSWNMFDRHIYPGGAVRLNMLRGKLGEEKFWDGVRHYLQSNMGKTVETVDFVRAMEQASGKNLGKWFDQWFYSPGYPKLKVSFSYDKKRGEGNFVIEQTQEDKDKGVGLFDLELEILWRDGAGNDYLEVMEISQARHLLVRRMDDPQFIILDPEHKIVATYEFSPGEDKLLAALENATTILGQVQAISELTKTGKRANIAAVENFWSPERYWGIRQHIFNELANVHNDFAIRALANLLEKETHPMVLETAANACGKQRDPLLRQAILRKLASKELPYRARAALLTSLGKQRNEADFELLKKYITDDSWRRVVRNSAWRGLGQLHTEAAFYQILENLTKDVKFFDEPVARAAALTTCALALPEHLQKQAVEALIDLTRYPSPNVRMAAAGQLARLKAASAIPVLEALKQRQANQDTPKLERLIRKIKSGSSPVEEAQKARKRVEELESKLAKVETRLQELEARNPNE